MAVKFINRLTGTVMYVDESRAEAYKAAGHTPAPAVSKSDTAAKPARKPTKKKET